jgi:hypothetical protein
MARMPRKFRRVRAAQRNAPFRDGIASLLLFQFGSTSAAIRSEWSVFFMSIGALPPGLPLPRSRLVRSASLHTPYNF